MDLKSARIEDPALVGYANVPEMVLDVMPDHLYEVWDEFGLRLNMMQPKYYVGQGDQYNELDNETLNDFMSFATASSKLNKHLYVVWQMSLKYQGSYDHGQAEKVVPCVFFEYYNLADALVSSGHGALTHKIDTMADDGITLVNGWSSNSGGFNSTGILPIHVMEVRLESDGRRVSPGSCIPITVVEELNRSNGYYTVGQRSRSIPLLYSLGRVRITE